MNNNADKAPQPEDDLLLNGLDGTNPLGFLAALGVLQTLTTAHVAKVAMSWSYHESSWAPVLHGVGRDRKRIASTLAKQLMCPFQPDQDAEVKRDEAQKAFDDKKADLRRANENLKKQRLRGNELKVAEDRELAPIRNQLAQLRSAWLEALQNCVPSLELSLGKHVDARCEELRDAVLVSLGEASQSNRGVLDLYASFGSDVCAQEKSDRMQATRFCFITGSGHQYFLDTVRQLATNLTEPRFEEALFDKTEPRDEKLSMRWDPIEDRRYAAMWSDPTASDNKARTSWSLNLLAYHGLQLLPSIPRSGGLRGTGWSGDEDTAWSWPIWSGPLTSCVVRSLLSHPWLVDENANRASLRSFGIAAVYQSLRIEVGARPLHKINFTPASRIR